MPRVNISDLNKYVGSGSGASYFKLANDKDVASVRYMIDSIEDLDDYAFVVHRVKVGDKERDVNCLREYNSPVSDCPFCEAKYKYTTQVYIPLYDVDSEEIKIWPRGPKYIQKLQGLCGRYKHLVSHIFEIERNGKAHSMQTTYENYEQGQDETTLDDLPEVPEILGTLVMDKTAEDMAYYVQEGEFPPDGEEEEDVPVRRRSGREKPVEDEEEEEERPRRRSDRQERTERRRTPAGKVRKEDKF